MNRTRAVEAVAAMPMPDVGPIAIWLIEDNASYRRNLARAIGRIEGMTCPRQFATLEGALPALGEVGEPPRVLLLDVGLPGLDGIAGLAMLRERSPRTRVVILTVFDDDDKIFRAICGGASGYLLKTSKIAEIADAIRQVVEGGAPMTPKVARRVLDLFSRMAASPPASGGGYGLTGREAETLQLMVEGLTKKEIAARLGLSVHTVNTHLRGIYEKLHVHTNTGAVAKALRENLI